MWDSISSLSSLNLVSDQQNLKTESFASKFIKKVKMQAAPFFSSGNYFLQAKYPPTIFGFCDLFNAPQTTTISEKESDIKMSMDDAPVNQNFSQLPRKFPKIPAIVSGFIGTKSYCPKRESFLDPMVVNLLNCKVDEKVPQKPESITRKNIAEEVKKYFSQTEANLNDEKSAGVAKSINSMKKIDKSGGVEEDLLGMKLSMVAAKPVCAVLPIVKTKESSRSFDLLSVAGSTKKTGLRETTDEISEEISLTMLIQSLSTETESAGNVESARKNSQLCLNCQANLKSLNCKKLKKLKVQEKNNCFCLEKTDNDPTKNDKKAKSSKSRKTRKSQQKRKNKLKQCRERQMIGIVDNVSTPLKNKIIDESNTGASDKLNSASECDFGKNIEMYENLPSPIMDDLEFDIVFDYETELCGVHSLSHSSDSRDYDCDNSTISFILNGNDDLYDSDSDCDSEFNGEFDDNSWQSFKTQFAAFQEVEQCASFRETCLEVNFDNDGFEILLSGNVCDSVDFAAQCMAENLRKVNEKWNEDTKDCHPPECKTSKVSFAPEEKLVQIRRILNICEDERKSDWELISLDRNRFQKRIANIEPLLSIILSKEHRAEIYNTRFSDMQD